MNQEEIMGRLVDGVMVAEKHGTAESFFLGEQYFKESGAWAAVVYAGKPFLAILNNNNFEYTEITQEEAERLVKNRN